MIFRLSTELAHILLWQPHGYRYTTPAGVDQIVSAEFPDRNGRGGEQLFEVVRDNLVHGPCGSINPTAPCMVEESGRSFCSKGFPRECNSETVVGDDCYPAYKRDASTRVDAQHPKKPSGRVVLGNGWVVPHNPYLTWRYRAHINVEVCSSIKAVKYLHKYLYKGPDRATAKFEADEIKQYLNGRFIGSPGAVWRLLEFDIDGMSPSVMPLVVHCEDEHPVSYDPSATAQEASNAVHGQTSELLAFLSSVLYIQ